MQRVELTDIELVKKDRTFYRVRLLETIDEDHKIDSLGGWVESLDNLRNPDTGEVEGVILDDARIYGNARIYENAVIFDKTIVRDNVIIRGNARIERTCHVKGNTIIEDDIVIQARCDFSGNSHLKGQLTLLVESKFTGTVDVSHFINQMRGSVYGMNIKGDQLTIGCKTYSLDWWAQNARSAAATDKFTLSQTEEYMEYIADYIKNYNPSD